MFFNSFGGGFPGHGHGHGRGGPSKPVDNTKYYELLGVGKDADSAAIKKAFRKQAMTHHPDKGGDENKFKEISKAYEVLSDPEKKAIYDEQGEEGLEGGGGGGGMPADIFDLFMGGGGGRGGRQRKRKGDDVVFPLKLTLEQMYTGCTKKLRLTKNVVCVPCKGKGGKSVVQCKECKGQGVKLIIRQVGPGMIQQMQQQCSACAGQGSTIPAADKCKKCKGARVNKEKQVLEVHVRGGAQHGQKMVYEKEADESPDMESGDVVVVLQQLEHPLFKREGDNLFMKKQITLLEALTGFMFTIDHLDNRRLVVRSGAGEVVKPGDFKKIRDEGMPMAKNTYVKGHMYVEFDVIFPPSGSLTTKQKTELKAILPNPAPASLAAEEEKSRFGGPTGASAASSSSSTGPSAVDEEEDEEGTPAKPLSRTIEEVALQDCDINMERRNAQQQARGQRGDATNAGHDDDDDDEDPRRGGQAGCQTQ